jgi:hypothetical protein
MDFETYHQFQARLSQAKTPDEVRALMKEAEHLTEDRDAWSTFMRSASMVKEIMEHP